jgi:cell cycle checkpoint protein
MAPPTKRRKRNVIPSSPPPTAAASDDEDDDYREPKTTMNKRPISLNSSPIEEASPFVRPSRAVKQALTPTKSQSTLASSRARTAAAAYLPSRSRSTAGKKSASTSPEKAKGKAKTIEKGRTPSLYTFFSTQVQKQTENTRPSAAQNGAAHIEEEEEGISDDDEIEESKVKHDSTFAAAATRRTRNMMEGGSNVITASQKFMKPAPRQTAKEDDTRPWAERFAPQNLDELAVHKKKVADVRGWLEAVMTGQMRQRLLVLKGAAGTGKTTTVQLLAKAMRAEVLEWQNPVGSMTSDEGFVSMTAQFEEFMGRGGKFGQLDIFSDDTLPEVSKEDAEPLDRRKSIILVEEFPNTFTRSSTALQGFRSTILQYLTANTPSLADMYSLQRNKDPVTPLIMVISETLLTTTSASADSFTAHRLLGPEILHHPGISVIEFNAIAPTLLQKALELVVLKESRKSGRRKTPGPLVLKRLGEIGDVRSAIGSLEFLCVRGEDADWGAKVNFSGAKGKKGKDTALTRMEEESLELITRREATLGIFHAIAKVVYNKRSEETSNDVLPPYLAHASRPRKSQVCVEELIDETGTDTSTFVSALHENYILSCDAAPSSEEFSDLDHVNACIDALSDSDLLAPSWDGSFNATGFGGGSGGGDVTRQDELSFQVAVRGLLFGLPDPVRRRVPEQGGLRRGKGAEAFRMFYPTGLKLWRQKEEIEALVDLSVTRVLRGEQRSGGSSSITSGAAAFVRSRGGVESWRSNYHSAVQSQSQAASRPQTSRTTSEAPPLLGLGASARKEMLLERLPYVVAIAKSQHSAGRPAIPTPLDVSELEKITKFTGIAVPSSAADADEDAELLDAGAGDGVVGEEWATDRASEEGALKKRAGRAGKMAMAMLDGGLEARFVAQRLEKTVLSDDDIEDD